MPSSKFLSHVTHLSAHEGGDGGDDDDDNNNSNVQSPPCYTHSHALISNTLQMPHSRNTFCRTKNKNLMCG